MKKFVAALMMLVVAGVLAFGTVGCGGKKDKDKGTTPAAEEKDKEKDKA